jgi:hypothetical protein
MGRRDPKLFPPAFAAQTDATRETEVATARSRAAQMISRLACGALRASFTAAGIAALSAGGISAAEPSPTLFKPSVVLTTAGAKTAMAAAAAEADANNWAVTIAVADGGGYPLLIERRGAAPMTVDIACGKARTAAISGKETTNFEKAVNGNEATRPCVWPHLDPSISGALALNQTRPSSSPQAPRTALGAGAAHGGWCTHNYRWCRRWRDRRVGRAQRPGCASC